MKKSLKALIFMTLMMLVPLVGEAKLSFSDVVQGHWSSPYIEKFVELDYVKGYEDGTFRPQSSITRAEFVKVVNRAFNLTQPGSTLPFEDIDREWIEKEVKIALNAGYLTNAQKFRPTDFITRQEAAKIVGILLYKNTESYYEFADAESIAAWAMPHVQTLISQGILSRNEMFRPQDSITRAEALKILFLATQPSVKAESIELSMTNVQLKVGECIQIQATVKPNETTNKQINWESQNPEVAIVDRQGNIQAVGVGKTTIIVSADSNASLERYIIVEVKEVVANSVTTSQSSIQLEVGESVKVSASVAPENTTDKTVKWVSENSAVATVDGNGTIVANGEGYTRIVVTSASNSSAKAYIEVNVKAKPAAPAPAPTPDPQPTPQPTPQPEPSTPTYTGSSVINQLKNEGWSTSQGGAGVYWSPYPGDVTPSEYDVYAAALNGGDGGMDLRITVAGLDWDNCFIKTQHVLNKILPASSETIINYLKNGTAGTWTMEGRKVEISYPSIAMIKIYGK